MKRLDEATGVRFDGDEKSMLGLIDDADLVE